MLQYTYESGRRLEHHFAGQIASEDDVAKLVKELMAELEHNPSQPVFAEVWKETSHSLKRMVRRENA